MSKDRLLEKELASIVKKYNVKLAVDILFPKSRYLLYALYLGALFSIILYLLEVLFSLTRIPLFTLLVSSVVFTFSLALYVIISLIFQKKAHLIKKIFLLRLLISILSGWLVFFSSEEFWEIEFDLSNNYILIMVIFVILVVFFFMLIEVKTLVGYTGIYKRLFIVLGFSLIISFNVGVFIMPNIMLGILDNSNVLSNNKAYSTKVIAPLQDFKVKLKNEKENIQKVMSDYDIILLRKAFNISEFYKDYSFNNSFIDYKVNLNGFKIGSVNRTVKNIPNTISTEKDFDKNINKQLQDIDSYRETITNRIKNVHSHTISTKEQSNLLSALSNSLNENELTIKKFINTKNPDSLKNRVKAIQHMLYGELIYLDGAYIKLNKKIDSLDNVLQEKSKPAVIRKWMTENGILTENHIFGKPIDYHPKLLIFQTFLAMFFGVFMQLLIQDKTVTESI